MSITYRPVDINTDLDSLGIVPHQISWRGLYAHIVEIVFKSKEDMYLYNVSRNEYIIGGHTVILHCKVKD